MRAAVLSLFLLGTALTAVAAPAPLPRRAKTAPSPFEGEWKMTQMDERENAGLTVVIRGNKMTFRIWDGNRSAEDLDAEFTARPGPLPAAIDVRLLRSHRRGVTTAEDRVILGTYQIEGATLRLTLGRNARPTGIDDKDAERYVFTRVRR